MNRLGRILVIAGVLVGIAQPAGADTGGGHCVFHLVPLERIGSVVNADLELVGCFATYEQALEAGVGQAIDFENVVTPQTVTDEAMASAAGATSVVIGTEYDNSNFTGESASYTAASTCTSATIWQVPNVGAYWNDRFQSGKGFGGCDTNRKFQHESFGGAVRVCTPNCGDYGTLSNQVTSLRWRV
jgi:hypothetical protein